MGKIRIKRKTQRSDPIGPRKVQAQLTTNEALQTNINSVLEQLSTLNAEENLLGLKKLSTIYSNSDGIPISVGDSSNDLNRKCIKSASTFLTNKRTDIKQAALNAFRCLSAVTDLSLNEILVEGDVISNLVTLIQEYDNDSAEEMDSEEQQCSVKEREKNDTLIQAVHLISNLCEVNEKALDMLNSSNVISILWKFVNPSVAGIDLALSVAQCFLTISEDNDSLIKHLQRSEDEIVKLLSIENSNHEVKFLHLNLLSAGLLMNLNQELPIKYLHRTFELIEKVVELDPRPDICKLSSQIPLDKESVLSSDDVVLLDKLVDTVNVLTTAFEIMTNICSSEEEEESMEVESDDDSDDMTCMSESSNFNKTGADINSDIYEAIVKLNLFQHSCNKTVDLPDNVAEILRNHLDTEILVRKYQLMRSRSFHFLNNLFLILENETIGGGDNLYALWTESATSLVKLAENSGASGNEELVEAITAALRGLIGHLVSLNYPALKSTSSDELKLIFQIAQNFSKSVAICANVIQIVSKLGVFFALQELEDLLKTVGTFLLHIINDTKCNVCVMAEALDAVMDVFAEDNTDSALKSLRLVPQVAAVRNMHCTKVRKEKQTLGEYGALISTVRVNLPQFLSYKTKRI
ncbi:hypothetical protein LSTR_LSTR000612 [Laodelphax striatellus]|uniref:SYO1-like TPR repeats domain-containing protein n=1 Tax=Laodelphax striatellus TaxID=195883 RepID=A0A482XGJ3_LAOST|nr:hypothetical protein LSTR_LSTR000612 [Laodelphax striatellus]